MDNNASAYRLSPGKFASRILVSSQGDSLCVNCGNQYFDSAEALTEHVESVHGFCGNLEGGRICLARSNDHVCTFPYQTGYTTLAIDEPQKGDENSVVLRLRNEPDFIWEDYELMSAATARSSEFQVRSKEVRERLLLFVNRDLPRCATRKGNEFHVWNQCEEHFLTKADWEYLPDLNIQRSPTRRSCDGCCARKPAYRKEGFCWRLDSNELTSMIAFEQSQGCESECVTIGIPEEQQSMFQAEAEMSFMDKIANFFGGKLYK